MAGPFSPIEQNRKTDISPVQLQRTEQVQDFSGVGQAILGAAGAVQEYRKDKATDAYETQIESVMEGLDLYRNGSQDDVAILETAAASGDAVARMRLEEYRAVQRGVGQGRIPSDIAAIRLRAITKAAINEAPEWADSFRAAGRQALGFSPEAEAQRRLLREPSAAGRTETQKQMEQLDAAIAFTLRVNPGMTPEQAEALVYNRSRVEAEALFAKNQMVLGDASDRTKGALSNSAMSIIMTDTLGQIAVQTRENGGIFDHTAAIALAQQTVAQQRAQMLAGVTNPSVANQINTMFDNGLQSLTNLINSSSMKERSQEFIATQASLQALGFGMEYPELLLFEGLRNPDAMFEIMNISDKLAKNPELAQSLGFGAQAQALQSGRVVAQGVPVDVRMGMIKMLQGQPPASDEERRQRAFGSRELLASPTATPELRRAALSELVDNSGEFTAITAMEDPKVMRQILGDSALTSQAANLLETKLESQAARLRTSMGTVPGIDVLLEGDKLVLSGQPAQMDLVGGGLMQQWAQLRTSVEQMNRMVAVNNKYAKANGSIPAYNIGDAIGEVKPTDFTQPAAEQQPLGRAARGTKDGIYKQADGTYVRVEGGLVYAQ